MIVDMNELRGGMEVGSVGVDRLLRYQSMTLSIYAMLVVRFNELHGVTMYQAFSCGLV